jgi:hypothetical protein
MKSKIKTAIVGGLVTMAALGFYVYKSGKTPIIYDVETHQVEQVFRDYGGYRTYSSREDGKVVEERFPFSYCRGWINYNKIPVETRQRFKCLEEQTKNHSEDAVVVKDLGSNEQGRVDILCGNGVRLYAEIHLPKEGRLEPGIGSASGKVKRNFEIEEIK